MKNLLQFIAIARQSSNLDRSDTQKEKKERDKTIKDEKAVYEKWSNNTNSYRPKHQYKSGYRSAS